mgnify:CR=1 FL=1
MFSVTLLSFDWTISITAVITAIFSVSAIMISVYLGALLSDRRFRKQQLEQEYETIGHPFLVLLRQASTKTREALEAYANPNKQLESSGRSALRTATRQLLFGPSADFQAFYEKKRSELTGFPKTIPVPLTKDSAVNTRLWEVLRPIEDCIAALDTDAADQERRLIESLRSLDTRIGSAINAIEKRYGDLTKQGYYATKPELRA